MRTVPKTAIRAIHSFNILAKYLCVLIMLGLKKQLGLSESVAQAVYLTTLVQVFGLPHWTRAFLLFSLSPNTIYPSTLSQGSNPQFKYEQQFLIKSFQGPSVFCSLSLLHITAWILGSRSYYKPIHQLRQKKEELSHHRKTKVSSLWLSPSQLVSPPLPGQFLNNWYNKAQATASRRGVVKCMLIKSTIPHKPLP